MKILTYLSSLILSGFVYLLFASYMTASAGLNSVMPLISFYSALIVFGFLSWFHFFEPKSGVILLIMVIAILFFSWPAFLLMDHFSGEYRPSLIESGFPLVFSVLTIFLAWRAKNRKDINRSLKFVLAIPPLLMTLYVGGYFTRRFFF